MSRRSRILFCGGIGVGCGLLILIAFLTNGVTGVSVVVSLVLLGISLAYILGTVSAAPEYQSQRKTDTQGSNQEYLAGVLAGIDASGNDAQVLVDAKGILRAANKPMAELLGKSADKYIGGPVEIFLPEFSRQILELLEQSRVSSFPRPQMIEGAIGSREYQAQIQLLENARTGDVWVRLRLCCEASIEDPMEFVSRFSAGIAHDLNNLLSSIVGSVGMLERIGKDRMSEREGKLLRAIGQSAKRGAGLAKDLMAFGKSTSAAREGKSIQLAGIVRQAIDALEGVERSKDCKIAVSVSEDLWVMATEDGLHQICMNLLFNAVDALDGEGDILVSAGALEDERVWVEISDTGVGMSQEVMDRVFEPFFSTKKTAANGEYLGGSGLGLANVKELLKAWNGTIKVFSVKDEGTSFRMVFEAGKAGVDNFLVH